MTELSAMTGANRSAVYRLVRVLLDRGMLSRDDSGRRYQAGGRLIALSAAVMQGIHLRDAARPIIRDLANRTSETVALYVRFGRYRICVDGIEGSHQVRRIVPLGTRLPLYAGTGSKVVLAHLPLADQEDILSWADSDGLDEERIRMELETIRRTGYMAAVGDYTQEVGAISAPIFDADGVIGSITVSGPGQRWTLDAMEAHAPIVVGRARNLSELLGFARSDRPGKLDGIERSVSAS
jgi:DNA-binding IclR family transcriptional regulator